jgi:hypothetical protein
MPQSPFDKLRVSGSKVQLVKFFVRAEPVEARKALFIA